MLSSDISPAVIQPTTGHTSTLQRSHLNPPQVTPQPSTGHTSTLHRSHLNPPQDTPQPSTGHTSTLHRSHLNPPQVTPQPSTGHTSTLHNGDTPKHLHILPFITSEPICATNQLKGPSPFTFGEVVAMAEDLCCIQHTHLQRYTFHHKSLNHNLHQHGTRSEPGDQYISSNHLER